MGEYLKYGDPGTGAPPRKGMSRKEHIAYRRPVTEARHNRERTAGLTEQAWRQRAAGDTSATAPDGSPLGTSAGPYGATYDPTTGETNLGWVRPNPQTGKIEANPEYKAAKRSGFIQPRGSARSSQFSPAAPVAPTGPKVQRPTM